jgi:hypothetical protein
MSDASMISRSEDRVWRDKLVADGKLAGVTTVVVRRGQLAH